MSWTGTEWRARVLTMSTAELREIAKKPAHGPRGMKALAIRELKRRESSMRCSVCHRKTEALLFGKCGVCLRMDTTTHGDYCCECGEWEPDDRLIGGRCPQCHVDCITGMDGSTPEGYVRAGEQLPPAEVFTKAEIAHLEFVKRLVATGKMGS